MTCYCTHGFLRLCRWGSHNADSLPVGDAPCALYRLLLTTEPLPPFPEFQKSTCPAEGGNRAGNRAEQEEMDTIIADGITDAKKSGVECRIEKKVMGFYSFVQEYGEPHGVTVESLLAQTSADSGLVQEHGTPEPQPELAVARSGDQPCQPTVPEGTPPSLASPVAARADDVDAWLEGAGLGKYADAIKEYGYDTIAALQFATEEDIVEMSEDSDVGMKKPHRRLLVGKWHELTA
eukprot:COSAG02_NODE_1481_length_12389_cov_15.643857_17_plen_235_part_00